MELIIDEIHYMELVVCFVMGANPPLHVIEAYVKRIWRNMLIDKLIIIRKGFSLLHSWDNNTKMKHAI